MPQEMSKRTDFARGCTKTCSFGAEGGWRKRTGRYIIYLDTMRRETGECYKRRGLLQVCYRWVGAVDDGRRFVVR